MKYYTLLLLLFVFPDLSQAKQDSTKSGKWSYEIVFSPNASYRILTSTEGEKWHVKERNNTEKPRFGSSVKFGVIRTLGERWSLGFGLYYTSIGFNKKSTSLTWATISENPPTTIKSSSKYTYITLPLLAYFKLSEKEKRCTHLIFGASLNDLESKNIVTKVKANDKWTSASNKGFIYNYVNFFALIGLGNSYKINDKWQLKTNLIFNQAFIPTNSTSSTKEYLNFLDINIGVNYRFH